jgi:hypothetical protein
MTATPSASKPHHSPPRRAPVRVRAYGLFPFTRRSYLVVQTCCFTALLIALVWMLLAPPDTDAYRKLAEKSPPADQLPIEAFATMLDNAPAILMGVAALGGIETLFMLRKFGRAEEAANRAEL